MRAVPVPTSGAELVGETVELKESGKGCMWSVSDGVIMEW